MANFLHMQPGDSSPLKPLSWRYNRLIPGQEYQRWQPGKFAQRVADVFQSSSLQQTLASNWTDRQLLQKCAERLYRDVAGQKRATAKKIGRDNSHVRAFFRNALVRAAERAGPLGKKTYLMQSQKSDPGEIDFDTFVGGTDWEMTTEDLKRVFDLVDIDNSGSISGFELTAVMQGMADPSDVRIEEPRRSFLCELRHLSGGSSSFRSFASGRIDQLPGPLRGPTDCPKEIETTFETREGSAAAAECATEAVLAEAQTTQSGRVEDVLAGSLSTWIV